MGGAELAALITAILGGTAAVVSAVAAAIAVLRKRANPDDIPKTTEEIAKDDLFKEYRLIVELQRVSLATLDRKLEEAIKDFDARLERERDECNRSLQGKEVRIKILEAKVAELGG